MTVFALSSQTDWYLTRGTGVVALLLFTAIVVLGTLSPMHVEGSERWPRFALGVLHRDLSLLALIMLALHIVTSVLDGFAPIGWLDAIIPLHSAYRPVWLGLGAVAFDLMLALIITSFVRRRLGYERWRAVHWLAYACWPIAVLHGLGTGTDAASWWLVTLTAACVAATMFSIAARIRYATEDNLPLRAAWIALLVATPLGIALFADLGPLKADWAAKAGTPGNLLHAAAPAATASASAPSTGTRSLRRQG
jgi:methionine sulfoxide reductase heme-binding subunit